MKWTVFGFVAFAFFDVHAGSDVAKNPPPECKASDSKCTCEDGKKQVANSCIKVNLAMGESTPWTGSQSCTLKVFADGQSPLVFTPESLYAVMGYTFKRIGNEVTGDGVTPKEVVFSHPNGEPVHFVFKDGESLGRPDPGFHIKMDERLQMVDAQGWACTSEPVYYDLYETDGSVRRFLATDATNERGKFVSVTDSRGKVTTVSDFGIDIVYGPDGVRQFLTPSRLANVTVRNDGYDVAVYPLSEIPVKSQSTGLYALPSVPTVESLSVRSAEKGKRALISLRKGEKDPETYIFDYVRGDWSLTRPSGVEERRDRVVRDSECARTVKEINSPSKELLSRDEYNYVWQDWGFAATNHVEGFGGTTRTTSWEYYTSGNGKGQVKSELHQSGLKIEYVYDANDRVVSTKRSGPDMMTEVTTYSYASVDPMDIVPPVDTRPRTVVKTLDGIECERTYYVYSQLTNIVERVGTQGAPYGGTNVLRTVTAFYPVVANDVRSGRIKSIRREDGLLDLYDYSFATNIWTETVTHLHEQSPEPVSGKTTRDTTLTNRRGETVEQKTEAFIDGSWYTIARDRMMYNTTGKRIRTENLAGQATVTDWDCCHKVSETQPDGSTTTWDYDEEGRMVAASRLIPTDLTNVTWVTTCYSYDGLGRQTATWTTNTTVHIGIPATSTSYDALGRVTSRSIPGRGTSQTSYSADGLIVTNTAPNGATTITRRNSDGDTISITGDGVTPEFYSRGVLADGTRWTKTVQGATASSPRFTKSYENMLGETVRSERSGFRGAVLSSVNTYDNYGRLVSTSADYEPTAEYLYDMLGNRIATTRVVGRAVSTKPPEWRKTETLSSFVLADSILWLAQTNIVSCSDSAIAPLVTSSAQQLIGLSAATPARSRSTDIRGNVTENEMLIDSSCVISRQTVPYATNKPLAISRYGVSLMDVSVSAVTNTVSYDSLGRAIAHTDGRGNTRQTEYNSFGQRSASIDALGNCTTYAYDQFGNLASVTDPLGHAIVYQYDLRGRKTYEGGATYPVRYTYDVFGNKATMMTYRNESLGPNSGDITSWLYDEASGVMTNKVYADGKGPRYDYDANGRLTKRTWARGVDTTYTYDAWGNLVATAYSDNTPTVTLAYDAMGRQVCAVDAAGVTTFAYDSFGSLTNETVVGVAGTNTIERFYDTFGRSLGYALNGVRQSTLAYDLASGRIATMLANGSDVPFTWNYLHGSDLKSSLAYPNGLSASWTYDANAQLLQVCNAFPTNVISQYDYTYDAAGRRVACGKSGSAFAQNDTLSYGYNEKSELTNAVAAVDSDYRYSYDFDEIGNRESSSERGTNSVYTANQLNQYTEISDSALSASPRETFTPQFDDDGNQTLIKTSTGIWSVTYNGENRPILWTLVNSSTPNSSTPPFISMSFDRMGRRVTKNNQRFVYNGYLQIANFEHQTSNIKLQTFVWDPTEPVATRPLVWNSSTSQPFNHSTSYYTHDGNKNVSEVVGVDGSVSAHYEYTPFGAVAVQQGESSTVNPWRFSSEFAEDDTATVYYNYRHYGSVMGRWLSRDTVRLRDNNLYLICENSVFSFYDRLGLVPEIVEHEPGEAPPGGWSNDINVAETHLRSSMFVINFTNCQDGKVKIKPSFGEIRIDIYFRTIADVVQYREDEFDHVKCYISFRNAVYMIMGVLNLMPCVCPDEASKIAQNAIEMYDHAVRKCDECNKKFDGPGGTHRHHEH